VGSEFRCFVKNRVLIGISQRYPNKLYPHLLENEERYTKSITNLFSRIIPKFPEENYIVDVFFDPNRAWILDFVPLNEEAKCCLFSWTELNELDLQEVLEEGPIYRVVTEESGIVFSDKSLHNLPYDMRNGLNNVSDIIEFMKKTNKNT